MIKIIKKYIIDLIFIAFIGVIACFFLKPVKNNSFLLEGYSMELRNNMSIIIAHFFSKNKREPYDIKDLLENINISNFEYKNKPYYYKNIYYEFGYGIKSSTSSLLLKDYLGFKKINKKTLNSKSVIKSLNISNKIYLAYDIEKKNKKIKLSVFFIDNNNNIIQSGNIPVKEIEFDYDSCTVFKEYF
ncbi:MAG: hypothetical protein U0457_12285 [Candidatus Sericytochromatia bacterium]